MRRPPASGHDQKAQCDQGLAAEGGDGHPDREGADDDDGDGRHPEQQPVGGGVEHLAERGDLVEMAGHVAVDAVRRARARRAGGRPPPIRTGSGG